MTTAASTGGTGTKLATSAPVRFRTSGYDSPEAAALRHFYSHPLMRWLRSYQDLLRNPIELLVLILLPLSILPASIMAPFRSTDTGWIITGLIVAGTITFLLLIFGSIVLGYSLRQRKLRREAAAISDRTELELLRWLSESYGLRLLPSPWGYGAAILSALDAVEISTADSAGRARRLDLVRSSKGDYELQGL